AIMTVIRRHTDPPDWSSRKRPAMQRRHVGKAILRKIGKRGREDGIPSQTAERQGFALRRTLSVLRDLASRLAKRRTHGTRGWSRAVACRSANGCECLRTWVKTGTRKRGYALSSLVECATTRNGRCAKRSARPERTTAAATQSDARCSAHALRYISRSSS